MNVDGIEVLKEKRGRSYDDVGPLLYQETGEAEVDYLARVQNAIRYNTLGFNYTNNLDEQLDHIIAGDKYALGILKEFVRKNLISIQSNCWYGLYSNYKIWRLEDGGELSKKW